MDSKKEWFQKTLLNKQNIVSSKSPMDLLQMTTLLLPAYF